jgi:hypothetical protein
MRAERTPHERPTTAIQAAMDQVLTSHGAYIPVELLLVLGRLRYSDYEAWRCGEHATLQTACLGRPNRLVLLLEDAADWAAQLGLYPEKQTYLGWGAHARQPLTCFEADWSTAESLGHTHYVRAGDADQLDLFLDSGASAAVQDLRRALRARDADAANSAVATLAERAPQHRLRPHAERLTDALDQLDAALAPERADAERRALEQSLAPAAHEVLGARARDLLVPFWRRLATALAGTAFDAQHPEHHASYAYAGALDWEAVIAAIEAEPRHPAKPVLLARLAEARRHSGDRTGAIAAWCQLCWRDPERARAQLADPALPDAGVHRAWLALLDLDFDEPPSAAFFPAWLLLTEPGLAQALDGDLADTEGAPEQAYQALHRLLRADTTPAREALRTAAPWLLQAYLERR